MSLPQWFEQAVSQWSPVLVTLVVVVAVLLITRHFLERRTKTMGSHISLFGQLLMLVLTGAGVVAVVLVVPMADTARGQLLSLLGILLTAAIALSSTTFIGNAMAGMMLRAIRHIRPGDFVRVGEHFGRISEQGLLHTELQTEDRDLTTLPNLYLVTNPVTVVRSSGTVLSATVSLGYDVPRSEVERLLLEAGKEADLREPFVQVVELGDFSVTYRIAGLLEDVKYMLSSRSRLRACMLDALHGGGVEVVSPTFMNQRQLAGDIRFVPPKSRKTYEPRWKREATAPERVIFDKADEAQAEAQLREELKEVVAHIEELEAAIAADPDSEDLTGQLADAVSRREELEHMLGESQDESAPSPTP